MWSNAGMGRPIHTCTASDIFSASPDQRVDDGHASGSPSSTRWSGVSEKMSDAIHVWMGSAHSRVQSHGKSQRTMCVWVDCRFGSRHMRILFAIAEGLCDTAPCSWVSEIRPEFHPRQDHSVLRQGVSSRAWTRRTNGEGPTTPSEPAHSAVAGWQDTSSPEGGPCG